MASSLSTIVAKDGTPTTIAGGLLAVDKSGAGTGPFFAAQTLVDTQGVNTATIKAATTAVASGDTAIAVGLHPTSPLPAGTNVIGHVIVDTLPSGAVTNAGTFAVQVTSAPSTAVTNAGTFSVQVSNANANGRAVPGSSAPVVLNSMTGQFVAASASATQLGSTGAVGDNLDGLLIIPATAAAGAVSVLWDGTNTRQVFAGGGTTALPTLAPFYVPLGFVSGNSGGFKVTTGTNVSVIGVGNFT